MRKRLISSWIFLLFASSLIPLSSHAATNLTFNPTDPETKGIYFDSAIESFIRIPASQDFDIGAGDFTIAWWQKAPKYQYRFPRLFQFGEGSENSDGFAVSEEDGRLYF